MENKIILLIVLIIVSVIIVGISIKKGLFRTENFDDLEDDSIKEEISDEDYGLEGEEKGIISTIVDKVSEVASSISETVSGALESAGETISSGVDTITQKASEVKDSVVNATNSTSPVSSVTSVMIDDLTGNNEINNTSTVSEIINSDEKDFSDSSSSSSSIGKMFGLDGLDPTFTNSDNVSTLSDEMTKDIGRKHKQTRNSIFKYSDPLLTNDFEYKVNTDTKDLNKKLKDISEMTKITEELQGYYENPGYYYL